MKKLKRHDRNYEYIPPSLCSLGMDPVSIGLAVGGQLLSHMANNSAANKQKKILAASQERIDKKAKENRALGMKEAENYDPTKRAESQAKIEGNLNQGYASTLAAPSPVSAGENTNEGNVSKDYIAGQAKAVAGRQANSINLAKTLAKMRAPDQLRLDESINHGDVASQQAQNMGTMQAQQQAGQIGAENVQPNGFVTLLGDAASAVGKGMALKGVGAASKVLPGSSGASIFR